VQWPHEGMWTIAFQTGTPGGDVINHVPAISPERGTCRRRRTPPAAISSCPKDVIELDMSATRR